MTPHYTNTDNPVDFPKTEEKVVDEKVIVGCISVDRKDARCIDCGQPFKFGVNVFTREGNKEISISGTCEKCFDSYFEDDEA